MIYFDNNATTPVLQEVLDSMLPYFSTLYANPSSAHLMGIEAKKAIEKAREQVAALIDADPEEIIFTSGATESNQAVLHTIRNIHDMMLFTSTVEHPSIHKVAEVWFAGKIKRLPVDSSGIIRMGEHEIDSSGLCSIIWANNETGIVSPIREALSWARNSGLLFHTDAVQASGKIHISVKENPVDYLSLSAHKIFGPKGIGALYIKDGAPFEPLVIGTQENNFRGGTEAVPLIVGFGKAAELAKSELSWRTARTQTLLNYLESSILTELDGAYINGSDSERLPNTTNIRFPNIDNDSLVTMLSQRNIAVSASSACLSSAIVPSHVLLAMGCSYEAAEQSIRFSLSHLNTTKEVANVVTAVKDVIEILTAE